MPDDDTKVAEQQEETEIEDLEVGKPDSPDEDGFSGAFSEALGGEGKKEEVSKETPGDEKKVEGKPDEGGAKEKTPVEEKTDDELAEERGKEILAAEDKAKKEVDEKAEIDKRAQEADVAAKNVETTITPLTKEAISNFLSMIPHSELPDAIEIDDQTYNVKEYLSDFPEAQVVSGLVTQKILERLVKNGVLITADRYNEKIADIEDRMYGMYFDSSVLRDVPDALKIVETKEYKSWLEKTATKEDKALLGSINPNDYVLGLKRFQKVVPVSAAAKKLISEKKAKKDQHDDLHSSTMKAGVMNNDLSGSEGDNNDFSDAFSEALEKEGKK